MGRRLVADLLLIVIFAFDKKHVFEGEPHPRGGGISVPGWRRFTISDGNVFFSPSEDLAFPGQAPTTRRQGVYFDCMSTCVAPSKQALWS